jgi:hypothetical protein
VTFGACVRCAGVELVFGSYGTTRRKAKGAGDEGPVALHFTSDAGAYLTTTPPERLTAGIPSNVLAAAAANGQEADLAAGGRLQAAEPPRPSPSGLATARFGHACPEQPGVLRPFARHLASQDGKREAAEG